MQIPIPDLEFIKVAARHCFCGKKSLAYQCGVSVKELNAWIMSDNDDPELTKRVIHQLGYKITPENFGSWLRHQDHNVFEIYYFEKRDPITNFHHLFNGSFLGSEPVFFGETEKHTYVFTKNDTSVFGSKDCIFLFIFPVSYKFACEIPSRLAKVDGINVIENDYIDGDIDFLVFFQQISLSLSPNEASEFLTKTYKATGELDILIRKINSCY